MLKNEYSFVVEQPLTDVWAFVEDIPRWASLFPGHQQCQLINKNDSLWTIKVSAAGVTRTDTVQVNVQNQNGPTQVDFTFEVNDLPVKGNGIYVAKDLNATQTEVTLSVNIIGSGPMAPMWEAVGTPLLPEFVKTFSNRLKAEMESSESFNSETATVNQKSNFAFDMLKGLFKTTVTRLVSAIRGLFGPGIKGKGNGGAS